VLLRSAGREEAGLNFVKSAEAKEFLQGSAVEKPDRCEKKSVDGEIRGCVENTKVAKNPTSGGTGGGVKEPDFEAECHPERMRKGTGGMEEETFGPTTLLTRFAEELRRADTPLCSRPVVRRSFLLRPARGTKEDMSKGYKNVALHKIEGRGLKN